MENSSEENDEITRKWWWCYFPTMSIHTIDKLS